MKYIYLSGDVNEFYWGMKIPFHSHKTVVGKPLRRHITIDVFVCPIFCSVTSSI